MLWLTFPTPNVTPLRTKAVYTAHHPNLPYRRVSIWPTPLILTVQPFIFKNFWNPNNIHNREKSRHAWLEILPHLCRSLPKVMAIVVAIAGGGLVFRLLQVQMSCEKAWRRSILSFTNSHWKLRGFSGVLAAWNKGRSWIQSNPPLYSTKSN